MADHAGAVDHGDECKPANSLDVLMKLSLQLPRIRYWLWWFPVQELRNPLVFYLEAWLADSIFGTDQTIIPDIVWMNQVLLTMDIVNNGNFVKITIYGQPRVQNRMKSMLLSLVSRRRQHRARAQKMKWLEEFLKACSSEIQTVQHTVA